MDPSTFAKLAGDDGQLDSTEIPLSHVARGVWTVTLPPAATRADFEYLVQVTTGKNQLLHFPATAPEMNQTVVVRETK